MVMISRVALYATLLAVLACCTAHADVKADVNVSKKLGLSLTKGDSTAAAAEAVVENNDTPVQAVLSVPQVSIDVDINKEKVPMVTMADAPCKNVCKDKCSTHLEKHCLNVTIPKKHCSIEKKTINKEFCQKKCKPTLTVNLPEFKLPSFKKDNPNPSAPPADVPTATPAPGVAEPEPEVPVPEPEAENDMPNPSQPPPALDTLPNPSRPPTFDTMPNPSRPPTFDTMPNPSRPPTFANPSAPPAAIAQDVSTESEDSLYVSDDAEAQESLDQQASTDPGTAGVEGEIVSADGRRLQGLLHHPAGHLIGAAVVHGAVHKAVVHGAVHKAEKPALDVNCQDVCVTVPFVVPELACEEDSEVVEKCTVVPDMTCEKECLCIPQKKLSLNLLKKPTVSVNVNKNVEAELAA